MNPIPEELQKALKSIKEALEAPEKKIRDSQLRSWRKFEQFWRGIQVAFWSEIAKDWRKPTQDDLNRMAPGMNISDYDRIVNIYRAHGESIIAALSVAVPSVRFYPEDADVPDDLTTAKAFSKLAKKIERDNDAKLQLVKILYTLYNQGLVAVYNYHDTDFAYGTTKKATGNYVPSTDTVEQCASCGTQLDENTIRPNETEALCPTCGENSEPIQSEVPTQIPEYAKEPKSQQRLAIFGPLNVKVPHYIADQESTPYLILETEQHKSMMQELYSDLADKITGSLQMEKNGRWARNPNDQGMTNEDLVTTSKAWIRPWAFNILGRGKEDLRKIAALKEMFPDGVNAVFVDDEFAEAVPENLDEHWTLSVSPVASMIHADPLGAGVAPIQELRNEVDALALQTMQYGIPEMFADPEVVDFDAYNLAQAMPGSMIPVKAKAGKSIADAFYQNKTAILSKEIEVYRSSLDQDAQFVSGAYPSIFGGQQVGGSNTAKEYEMSRNAAMQRLSISYVIIMTLWPKMISRAVRSYIANMKGDENFVDRSGDSYVNIWIRRSEMSGSVGHIEADTSDQFPVSWNQKRGMLLELIGMKNQNIDGLVFNPENIDVVGPLIGPELKIPGSDQRDKQLAEIADLLKGQVMQDPNIDPQSGMQMNPNLPPQPPQPSVPIDAEIDDDNIHIGTIVSWAISETGQETKLTNPAAYANVMAHLEQHKSHQQFIQQQQMMQQMQVQQTGGPPKKANGSGAEGPPPLDDPQNGMN